MANAAWDDLLSVWIWQLPLACPPLYHITNLTFFGLPYINNTYPSILSICGFVWLVFRGGHADATGLFDGAFAAVSIKEGELIEKGVMRRLPEGFDGNACPYIFTWSDERPNKVSGVFEISCGGLSIFHCTYVENQWMVLSFRCHVLLTAFFVLHLPPSPTQTWGMGSGCAPFYNTCKEGTANTKMVRFFDEDRFEIYATRDIEVRDPP